MSTFGAHRSVRVASFPSRCEYSDERQPDVGGFAEQVPLKGAGATPMIVAVWLSTVDSLADGAGRTRKECAARSRSLITATRPAAGSGRRRR